MGLPRILPITEGNKTDVMNKLREWIRNNFQEGQIIKWKNEKYQYIKPVIIGVLVHKDVTGQSQTIGFAEFYQHVSMLDLIDIDWKYSDGTPYPIYAEHWLVAGATIEDINEATHSEAINEATHSVDINEAMHSEATIENKTNLQVLCKAWSEIGSIVPKSDDESDAAKRLLNILKIQAKIITETMPYDPPYCREMIDNELAKYDLSIDQLINKGFLQ